MNVWLVTIGEPVPVGEAAADRLHRTGALAHYLAARGHQVIWWTSTFDHFRKKHWFEDDAVLRPCESLEIRLLHGRGYRSTISIARLRDHRLIARKFARAAAAESMIPDVIVAGLPTIELSLEAVRYGRARGVPVVVDARDMWPDIFVDAAPKPARPVARLLLRPLFGQARQAFAGATAIIGPTDGFVVWGLQRAGRERTDWDRAFPFAYELQSPKAEAIARAEAYWDEQGLPASGGPPVACFVGTLGRQLDLQTVLKAARLLAGAGAPWRFVLCGLGDRLESYRQEARDLPNVVFPGWVDKAQIYVLLRRAAIGLDPLPDRYDFLVHINNKAVEYLSAGLPVVSTPARGVLAELLLHQGCGASYNYGDADGLAELLGRLAGDPDRLAAMRSAARRTFAERFTAEKVYGGMEAYLMELAGQAGQV